MPLYEFKCESCGNVTEKLFKITDSTTSYQCPLCGGTSRKIISRIGRINMHPGPLTGIDDTDDLTLGKIVANKGMPAEHKRRYAELRKRQERVAEYEKGLNEIIYINVYSHITGFHFDFQIDENGFSLSIPNKINMPIFKSMM